MNPGVRCTMTVGRLRPMILGVAYVSAGIGSIAEPMVFRHVLDNSPLDVKARPNEVETEAVRRFKETGKNPYNGDEAALADGKGLYERDCQACHLPNGSGRIGPTLIANEWKH